MMQLLRGPIMLATIYTKTGRLPVDLFHKLFGGIQGNSKTYLWSPVLSQALTEDVQSLLP